MTASARLVETQHAAAAAHPGHRQQHVTMSKLRTIDNLDSHIQTAALHQLVLMDMARRQAGIQEEEAASPIKAC